MAERSVFQKLVDTLPERERKDLLDKIARSMDFERDSRESIYHKEMPAEERERLIAADLERLTPLSRFFLWLRGLFSGKNRKELVVAQKIRALKGAINRKSAGLTGFETRDLTPKVAESFYRLYLRTLPLLAVYRKVASRTRELRGGLVELFEEGVPEARVRLHDVVPHETLEEIYEEKSAEAAVRREVLLKVESYVARLDDSLFRTWEEKLAPFFFAKEIVFFPYVEFFGLFHVAPEAFRLEGRPRFEPALAVVALEYLERMYFAVFAALHSAGPGGLLEPLARYLARLSLESEEEEEDNRDRLSGAERGEHGLLSEPSETGGSESTAGEDRERMKRYAEEVERISDEFGSLMQEIRRFDREMPLADLVRYFLKDPYYKLFVYLPQLRLREHYQAMLKIRLLAELSSTFEQLRSQVVDRQIAKLFDGREIVPFANYRAYEGLDYEGLELPTFAHAWSMNVLYNYIRIHYHGYLQEVVKILSTIVLVQSRISRNKLLQHASVIEDVEQKIREFDESLGPDTPEGRVFHHLLASVGEGGHERAFRTVVAQKDSQAASFVERGRESLIGLQAALREVASSGGEPMKERLDTRYYLDGSLVPLSEILAARIDQVGNFLVLFNQLLKIEGG